jgi:acetyl-CoA carboxylase carboxyl transferase subunit beta
MLFNKQLARNLNVCTKCAHHFRMGARERIELLVDKDSFVEHDAALSSGDPLGFVDSKPYPERVAAAQTKSGEKDAVICGSATIG